MSGAYTFMLKRLYGVHHIRVAAKHNHRTMYAQGAPAEDIDLKRSHLNYSLAGATTPDEVVKLWRRLREDAGILKPKRKDEVSAIEIVFSLPDDTDIDVRAYFQDCTDWAMRTFGGEANILASDVHLDEAQPHCHVLMLPMVNRKMCGSDLYWGESRNRKEMHEDFHAAVGRRYGLRMQSPKLAGRAKYVAAQQVIKRLHEDADAALVSNVRDQILQAIAANPGPFVAALDIKVPLSSEFERIALSAGAGPKTASAEASRDREMLRRLQQKNPIGFGATDGAGEDRTLSCVGFGEYSRASVTPDDHAQQGAADPPGKPPEQRQQTVSPAGPQPPETPSRRALPQARLGLPTTYHRDADLPSNTWDPMIGEHVTPASAPLMSTEAAALARALMQQFLVHRGAPQDEGHRSA